jgi:Multiubiquitin
MQHEAERRGLNPEGEVVVEKVEITEAVVEQDDGEVLELIEIEVYASTRKRKPRAHRYAFLVGKQRIEVEHPIITGRRILELAHKVPPEKYILRQIEHGGVLKVIGLDEHVDLRAPCIERFRAMPRTAQDG